MSGMNIPDLADSYSGRLLIMGTGRCLWEDIERFVGVRDIAEDWADVMTVNDAVMYVPYPVSHAYSHDDPQLVHWVAGRRRRYQAMYDLDIIAHSVTEVETENVVEWPFPNTGTSGLGAAYVACALGYSDIVLLGLPLDDSGHFYDPPWIRSNFSREENERRWIRARDEIFQGRVKSVSGRTRDILGKP